MKKNPNKDVPFSFSYLGYKKGVNIFTESYQFKLCMDLLKEGYKIILPNSISLNGTLHLFKEYLDKEMISFEQTQNAIQVV